MLPRCRLPRFHQNGGTRAFRFQLSRGRFGSVRRCYSDPLDLAPAEQEPRLHLLAAASPQPSAHLVALHAAFEDADAVHLVLDLCPGGDLFALVQARGALPELEVAGLMAQLADALAACHHPSSPTRSSSAAAAGKKKTRMMSRAASTKLTEEAALGQGAVHGFSLA